MELTRDVLIDQKNAAEKTEVNLGRQAEALLTAAKLSAASTLSVAHMNVAHAKQLNDSEAVDEIRRSRQIAEVFLYESMPLQREFHESGNVLDLPFLGKEYLCALGRRAAEEWRLGNEKTGVDGVRTAVEILTDYAKELERFRSQPLLNNVLIDHFLGTTVSRIRAAIDAVPPRIPTTPQEDFDRAIPPLVQELTNLSGPFYRR
jgi:hypothetical protein